MMSQASLISRALYGRTTAGNPPEFALSRGGQRHTLPEHRTYGGGCWALPHATEPRSERCQAVRFSRVFIWRVREEVVVLPADAQWPECRRGCKKGRMCLHGAQAIRERLSGARSSARSPPPEAKGEINAGRRRQSCQLYWHEMFYRPR